jgi:hypothetical protein
MKTRPKITIASRLEWHKERAAVYQALYNRLPVYCTMRRAHAIHKMQVHRKQVLMLQGLLNIKFSQNAD